MLNETKAKVCASIVEGKSFLARSSGNTKAERKSWGRKARDSRWMDEVLGVADEMYKSVL